MSDTIRDVVRYISIREFTKANNSIVVSRNGRRHILVFSPPLTMPMIITTFLKGYYSETDGNFGALGL